jgi:hypothetical protein
MILGTCISLLTAFIAGIPLYWLMSHLDPYALQYLHVSLTGNMLFTIVLPIIAVSYRFSAWVVSVESNAYRIIPYRDGVIIYYSRLLNDRKVIASILHEVNAMLTTGSIGMNDIRFHNGYMVVNGPTASDRTEDEAIDIAVRREDLVDPNKRSKFEDYLRSRIHARKPTITAESADDAPESNEVVQHEDMDNRVLISNLEDIAQRSFQNDSPTMETVNRLAQALRSSGVDEELRLSAVRLIAKLEELEKRNAVIKDVGTAIDELDKVIKAYPQVR